MPNSQDGATMHFEPIVLQSLNGSVIDAEVLRADAAAIRALLTSGHVGAALTMFDVKRREFITWDTLQQISAIGDGVSEAPHLDPHELQELREIWAQHCRDLKLTVLTAHREAAATLLSAHVLEIWDVETRVECPDAASLREEEKRLARRFSRAKRDVLCTEEIRDRLPLRGEASRDAPDDNAENVVVDETGGVPPMAALFAQQVAVRSGIAMAAGFKDYRSYRYAQLKRIDYGPEAVAQFRAGVQGHVVPLLAACVQRQALEFAGMTDGTRKDQERVTSQTIRPAGGPRLLYDRMTGMFSERNDEHELGNFYRKLFEQQSVRLNHAPDEDASVTVLPIPVKGQAGFLRVNCNGSAVDIDLMAQGLGRGYQYWRGGGLTRVDDLLPTPEAASIPPKALSLLMMSGAERLLTEGAAQAYRQARLTAILWRLVESACLDAFEHEIYAHPEWSPEQRDASWNALCDIFLPWSRTAHGNRAQGALNWHEQAILFQEPFAAINAALSDCCALQIWLSSRVDATHATELFKSICGLGGVYPFQTLIEKSGLISPFSPDALPEIMLEIEPLLWP